MPSNGPSDIIGKVSSAAISSIKQKMKDLKKDAKDANKEFEKAKKTAKEAGTEIDKDVIARQRKATKVLTDYVNQVKASNRRKNEFIAERKAQPTFFDTLDQVQMRYNTVKGIFHTIKHAADAMRDDTSKENIGKDINGQDQIITNGYRPDYHVAQALANPAGKLALAGLKSGNLPLAAVAGAVWGASKSYTAVQEAAQAERLNKLYQPQERLDFQRSGLGGSANFAQIKQAAERDYLRKNSDTMLLSEGLARKLVSADPSAVSAMHSAVQGTIGQVASLRQSANAALDTGDFQTYTNKMKEAMNLIPNEKINIWQDPMALYTQREQSRDAAKTWARSQMQKAGPRTGD